MKVQKQQVKKWVGKNIFAVKKDGTVVKGKLVKISGQKLYIKLPKDNKAHTKALIPLVLFDLLAIGSSPYAYGGYGYGGYGAYGANPYGKYGYPQGFGFPGFF